MTIIVIVFSFLLAHGMNYEDIPLQHKATFTFSHECKQVKGDDEVCVDLTTGETALYAPKD
jgi:hypothetical protein